MSGPRAPHQLRHKPQRTPLKFEGRVKKEFQTVVVEPVQEQSLTYRIYGQAPAQINGPICGAQAIETTIYAPFPAVRLQPQNICNSGSYAVVSVPLIFANIAILALVVGVL